MIDRDDSAVLKRMREETAALTKKKMKQAKASLGLKRRPKKRLPGGGRKSKYAAIESDLLSLIQNNRPCPFLSSEGFGNLGVLNSTGFFYWDSPSLARSMSLRVAEFGMRHYASDSLRAAQFAQRFVARHGLTWLGKHQLSQFDGISLEEARRRCLGTMCDFVRHMRKQKRSGSTIHLAFLDETSL